MSEEDNPKPRKKRTLTRASGGKTMRAKDPQPDVNMDQPMVDFDNGHNSTANTAAVEERLKESYESCMKAYVSWRNGGQDNDDITEELSESVHSLRRVLARIEIDMASDASSRRNQKPIPVPIHRSADRK